MIRSLQASIIFILFFSCLSSQAQHTTFQTGDIFLAQGLGVIQWRDSNGVLIKNINTGDIGGNYGIRINPVTGQLWVPVAVQPNSPAGIRIVNTDGTTGNLVNITPYQGVTTSVSFDNSGNGYVGGLWNDNHEEVIKIDPGGTSILDHFRVSTDGYVYGAEWVEMDCNDSIMYYNFLNTRIKRYNVKTHQQLPDLFNFTGAYTWFFAMRFLPDSSLLVAGADNKMYRFNRSGVVLQTYEGSNPCAYFAMAATPDGKYFWAGGLGPYGPMYKFDITTGHVVHSFLAGPAMPGMDIHGIAIAGDAVKNCYSTHPPDLPVAKSINAWPNPSHGNFTIETSLSGKLTIRVFNKLGQTVYASDHNFTGTNNRIPVSLNNLAAGIYIIQIRNKDEVKTRRILIN